LKILLVQTSFLGDTILSTPVISGIKKIYPGAELWMMTTPLSAELVIRDPLLTGVITDNKKDRNIGITGILRMKCRIQSIAFDRVYSLHRSFRTALLLWLCQIPARIGFSDAKLSFLYHETRKRNPKDHDVIRNLSLLSDDISLESLEPELRLFSPEKNGLSENIRKTLPETKSYVVLVPGSAWKTKMWNWEGYRETAKYLLEKSFYVVLLGTKQDEEVGNKVARDLDVINLTGKTTVADTMYIIKNSRLVVCNDSMTLHLASAFKIPNVAVFCATSPKSGFSPWRNNAIVVEKKDLSCKPCRRHGGKKCPAGTESCMNDLSHHEVIRAVEKLLKI